MMVGWRGTILGIMRIMVIGDIVIKQIIEPSISHDLVHSQS